VNVTTAAADKSSNGDLLGTVAKASFIHNALKGIEHGAEKVGTETETLASEAGPEVKVLGEDLVEDAPEIVETVGMAAL
jgi:hypothetical protein